MRIKMALKQVPLLLPSWRLLRWRLLEPSRRAVTRMATLASRFRNFPVVWLHIWRGRHLDHLALREIPWTIRFPQTCPALKLFDDIWSRRVYESDTCAIRPGDTVIDVGANVGFFALHAARVPGVTVYAYEPLAENYEYLLSNVEENGISNVICKNVAVAGAPGPRRLYLTSDSVGNRLFQRTMTGDLHEFTTIDATTLAKVLDKLRIQPHRCFLKLDCEGTEFEILLNTPPEYLAMISVISLEFHDHITDHAHTDLRYFLERHGFRVWTTDWSGPFGYLHAWHHQAP